MFTTRIRLGGASARTNARRIPLVTLLAVIVMTISSSIFSHPAHAQTTRTWATPGVNPDIANGPNWVGGVAPNFAGDATTDSAIFSASTNAAVRLRNVLTGDLFAAVTFDASAPAYTFSLPAGNTTNELVILAAGQITNSSPNTQTLTGIAAVTLNGAAGTPGTMLATSGNTVTNLSFDVGQIKFNNPGSTANGGAINTSVVDLTAGFDVRTSTILGVVNGAATSSLYVQGEQSLGTGGRLFITGDSGTNPGRLVVGIGGVVRIAHNNALGDDGGVNSANATILLGGFRNGRVELPGNITTNEAFTLNARQGADIFSPHILNTSGNNTLTGVIRTGGGGNCYNFGSDAGTLFIQSDFNNTQAGDRSLTFQRGGNIVLNGNIFSSGSNNGSPLVRYDTGTTTINGSANINISNVTIRGGTLALGASAGITFAALADDLVPFGGAPRVTIDAGATLDVSAKVGGFNLTQTLQGNGTVKGSLIMAGGTQVLPGATAVNVINNVAIESFADAVGTLTFQSGGMNLSAGSSMVWQLGALSTSNPGMDFDQIVNGGNLALGGTSNLTIDLALVAGPGSDPFWTTNRTWKIIDATSNTGSTNFASITNGTFGSMHFTTTVGAGADAGDIFLNWIASATAHPGDFDSDGDVDGADFVAWQTNFPKPSGATLAQGDADSDGDVDGADFVVWQTNFPFTPGPGASPVPEPRGIVLFGLGSIGLIFRWHRRSVH